MERSFYKAFYVYSGDVARMTDVLRASWVFPDFDSLYQALSILWKSLGSGSVLRIKDR